jgi:hypothetical protein
MEVQVREMITTPSLVNSDGGLLIYKEKGTNYSVDA